MSDGGWAYFNTLCSEISTNVYLFVKKYRRNMQIIDRYAKRVTANFRLFIVGSNFPEKIIKVGVKKL